MNARLELALRLLSAAALTTGFRRAVLGLGVLVWLGGVSYGLSIVWAYENRPGAAAAAPVRWPADTALTAASDRPTLVFLAHPQCTCTFASLDELAEALARTTHPPKTYVLFIKPAGFEADWEKTDLWRKASSLPGVTVLRDDAGVEARRFGVETSGQTLLYEHGALIFSGGITGSRGHAGDNDGQAALVDLLTRGAANRRVSNVFGCPLFSKAAS